MNHLRFIFSRLWRYLNIYFLKPHDAINDTLTASLLYRLDWSDSVVEIGSGDGVYSYIMHGGSFPLWFDRYLLTDLTKQDIYDTHQNAVLLSAVSLDDPNICLAIDAKQTHVSKIKEIGFAKHCVVSAYEALPLASASVSKVFYYTPHGLRDHEQAINEAYRILAPDGDMLILLYDKKFESSFLCYRIAMLMPGRIGRYFARMDNGRFDEITNLAKSPSQWEIFFAQHGLTIVARHSGLSCFAWKAYDIQTRPVLKPLIRFFNSFSVPIRTALKLLWMTIWYPYLVLFYFLFSNEFLMAGSNCFLAFQLKKIELRDQ